MGNKKRKLSIDEELELFRRADNGELPVCPLCGKGRIHSIGRGYAYSCDNKNCRYQVVMTLTRKSESKGER